MVVVVEEVCRGSNRLLLLQSLQLSPSLILSSYYYTTFYFFDLSARIPLFWNCILLTRLLLFYLLILQSMSAFRI